MVLVRLKYKFHKIVFTGYLVSANLWILNQIKDSKSCTTEVVENRRVMTIKKLLTFVKFYSLVT